MKVSIVIPNYNGQHLLEKNLPQVMKAVESYQRKTQNKAEIIVTDDGSSDSSVTYLQHLQEKEKIVPLRIARNSKNMGFSSAVNKGVHEADGEIVVLLNTDVVPEIGFLQPLIADFADPQVFAVGCVDKSMENGKAVLRGRGIGKWEKGFLVHAKGAIDKNNTLWASGGSSAFRRSLWEKLGGLYPVYDPFYWEDIDLSYRAQKAGYKVLFEKNSMVVHEHEQGAVRTKYSRQTVRKIAYRNQFLFVWINASDREIIVSHWLWLPVHLLKALMRHDSILLSGFIQSLAKILSVINYRRHTQRFVRMSDHALINQYSE